MARVLVVDDEEGIREFVADALEIDGHEVAQAPDGRGAQAILNEAGKGVPFEVMLTDLKMPGMNGMELLGWAKATHPGLEIIMLTAHGSVNIAVEAMKAGAFDFLEKPISGLAELRALVRRAAERHALRAETEAKGGPPLSYGAPAMEPALRAIDKVARTEATVLLLGESGVGKEEAARAIHRKSGRASGPFVPINCAALSANLLESELFGHEKGAFTGATARKQGKLEVAAGGTFFLDEVGELDPALQAKLLRVLQEKRFTRVGGTESLSVDVRFVAATNRDLKAMIREGSFREDLYHRVAVFPIELPPLRERKADVIPLAEHLLKEIAPTVGKARLLLDPEARDALLGARWPGNIRELKNALARAAILAEDEHIRAEDLTHLEGRASGLPAVPTMTEMEQAVIEKALRLYGGNRKKAAEHLGIGLRTLYDKIKKYGLR